MDNRGLLFLWLLGFRVPPDKANAFLDKPYMSRAFVPNYGGGRVYQDFEFSLNGTHDDSDFDEARGAFKGMEKMLVLTMLND